MTALADMDGATNVDEIVAAVRQIQKEGKRLPSERVLAVHLDIKRYQLRKALEIMRQNGDLDPAPVRRASATHPRYSEELVRMTNPLEVIELRLLMEPGLTRLASLRASALEIAQIRDAATTPENAPSGAVDLSFHQAIVRAARNHLAAGFYTMLRQVGIDARVQVAQTTPPSCPKRIAQRDAEHRRIAGAIARRDPETAEIAMRAHLLSVQKQINEGSNSGTVSI